MMFNDIRLHCGRGGLELRDRPHPLLHGPFRKILVSVWVLYYY